MSDNNFFAAMLKGKPIPSSVKAGTAFRAKFKVFPKIGRDQTPAEFDALVDKSIASGQVQDGLLTKKANDPVIAS